MPVDDDGYCPGGKCGCNRRDPRNAKKQTRQRSREVQEFADMLKQEFSPNPSHREGTVFDQRMEFLDMMERRGLGDHPLAAQLRAERERRPQRSTPEADTKLIAVVPMRQRPSAPEAPEA
jgi:hypothetical protein